jgi:hypothetical protein
VAYSWVGRNPLVEGYGTRSYVHGCRLLWIVQSYSRNGLGNIHKDFITHVVSMQKQTSVLSVRGCSTLLAAVRLVWFWLPRSCVTGCLNLMFCWLCIIVRVYQYSETNVRHFLFSLLRIKGLYMFRALLAHPQKALRKRHLVYCVRVMSVGCTRIEDPFQSWCSQYTKCRLCCTSWGLASNARNM